MSVRGRVVILGEGLRPGQTMDDAIEVVSAVVDALDGGEASIAVLDRGASEGGLAVGWDAVEADASPGLATRVAELLGRSFASVVLVEGGPGPLAESPRLT